MEIPDAKNLGLCREYPQVYMIGYGCRKILILWLTDFGDDPGRPDSELLLREVLEAKPEAEQEQSGWRRQGNRGRTTLTAHSEPYNQRGLHASSMTDSIESFDQR